MSDTITAPPKMSALAGGTHDGVEWCVVRAPLWGAINGYVRVPDEHPWAEMDYDAVHEADPHLEVHGGLTFSRDGWIGFDTLHAGDYWPGAPTHYHSDWCHHWTQDEVVAETKRLAARVSLIGGVAT